MCSSQTIHYSLSEFVFPKLTCFYMFTGPSCFLLVKCLFMLISHFLFFLLLFNTHLKIHLLILKGGRGTSMWNRNTNWLPLIRPPSGDWTCDLLEATEPPSQGNFPFSYLVVCFLIDCGHFYILREQNNFSLYMCHKYVLSYGRFYFCSFMVKFW